MENLNPEGQPTIVALLSASGQWKALYVNPSASETRTFQETKSISCLLILSLLESPESQELEY